MITRAFTLIQVADDRNATTSLRSTLGSGVHLAGEAEQSSCSHSANVHWLHAYEPAGTLKERAVLVVIPGTF